MNVLPVVDLYPQLLRDAFAVLDRYRLNIANRDPTKSLNEDCGELLRRVRAALEPLLLNDALRPDDVAEIVQRIDAAIARRTPDGLSFSAAEPRRSLARAKPKRP